MSRIRKFLKLNLLLVLFFSMSMAYALDSSNPPANGISYKKAKRIALKARPGKIKDFEQKQRNGKWVFSFKIVCADQVLREVDVDAENGDVVYGAKKRKK
jgi:uncharacterized membrane protein YkoI